MMCVCVCVRPEEIWRSVLQSSCVCDGRSERVHLTVAELHIIDVYLDHR